MATNEELEAEINKLNIRLFKSEVKFESLLRLVISKGMFTPEEYQKSITDFQNLNGAINQINGIHSIMDKVNAASKYNETSTLKIQGEDLGLVKIIEDAGGTSDFTARYVLSKLPCGASFTAFMKQFIDPTKNPSPDALIPDAVVNPQ